MDTKAGVPALSINDPMSLVARYSQDMRDALLTYAQAGAVTLDFDASGSASNLVEGNVSFHRPFPAGSTVRVVTDYGESFASPFVETSHHSVTRTGFVARMRTIDGATHTGARTLTWIAVLEVLPD